MASYTLNLNLSNLKLLSKDISYELNSTKQIQLIPLIDFILPKIVSVSGADYEYNSTTGVIKLSNLTASITVTASADYNSNSNPIISIDNNILNITVSRPTDSYIIDFEEI